MLTPGGRRHTARYPNDSAHAVPLQRGDGLVDHYRGPARRARAHVWPARHKRPGMTDHPCGGPGALLDSGYSSDRPSASWNPRLPGPPRRPGEHGSHPGLQGAQPALCGLLPHRSPTEGLRQVRDLTRTARGESPDLPVAGPALPAFRNWLFHVPTGCSDTFARRAAGDLTSQDRQQDPNSQTELPTRRDVTRPRGIEIPVTWAVRSTEG